MKLYNLKTSLKFFFNINDKLYTKYQLICAVNWRKHAKNPETTKKGQREKPKGLREQKFSCLGVYFNRKAVDYQYRENTHKIQGRNMVQK